MSNTNIITESKKITDLLMVVGYSDKAVVLIVDGGKTVQMSLSLFVEEIINNVKNGDNFLSRRITSLEEAFPELNKAVKLLKEEYGSFKTSVSNRCRSTEDKCNQALDKSAEAWERANAVAYRDEYFNYWDLPLAGYAFATHDAVIGDVFTPEAQYMGGEYYSHSQEVKEGWALSFEECQEFIPLLDSKYFVAVNADNIVLDIVPVSNFQEDGYEYKFKTDGKFYLTSKWQSNDPVFKLRYPSSGVPAVSENDNGKTLQVVDGRWTAVDALTAEVGDEVAY